MILPSTDPAFEWRQMHAGPALMCLPLRPYARHLFTSRYWTLGSAAASTDDERPWGDVAMAMDVVPRSLVRPRQVHGHTVVLAREGQTLTGDIVLSDDPTLAVAVQVADCVPLLLADARTGAVGAVHAGWRGLAARVPAVAVEAMTSAFATRPGDLVAAAGPSIGACCYEVGPDVWTAFAAAEFDDADMDAWFLRAPAPTSMNPSMPGVAATNRDRWFFDGWQAVVSQLVRVGVRSDRISVARTCTASHEALCSYRRDGSPAGRLAAAIRPRSGRP
jgi:YfiH family protein